MFVPSTVKRPHWVMLGRRAALTQAPGTLRRHTVYGKGLVTFTGEEDGELHVLEEACPHRGASLAGGRVSGTCVVCPLHGRTVGVRTNPAMAYDYAALQGLVWVDVAKDLCTQHVMPPYYPEFSSQDFRASGYTTAVWANAVLLLERLLDPLATAAGVEVRREGPVGMATYALGGVEVEHEYRAPFTASVRLRAEGRVVALAMVSLLPASAGHTGVHVQVARGVGAPRETEELVSAWVGRERDVDAVDPAAWSRSHLGPGDELVAAYRRALQRFYPEMLCCFVR